MAVLTTSFNIVVKTYEQKWDDVISNIRSGGGIDVGTVFPMKLTDGTMLNFIAVDVDDNGDVTFGERDGLEYMRPFHNTYNTVISWAGSDLRQYLMNDFLSLIPSNIKNAIKEKTATYQLHPNTSTTTESATDKIWIPTLKNLSLNGNGYGDVETGHKALEYYKTVGNRTKPVHTKAKNWDGSETTTGGTNQWRTASPGYSSGSTRHFSDVNVSGARVSSSQQAPTIIVPHLIIGAQ